MPPCLYPYLFHKFIVVEKIARESLTLNPLSPHIDRHNTNTLLFCHLTSFHINVSRSKESLSLLPRQIYFSILGRDFSILNHHKEISKRFPYVLGLSQHLQPFPLNLFPVLLKEQLRFRHHFSKMFVTPPLWQRFQKYGSQHFQSLSSLRFFKCIFNPSLANIYPASSRDCVYQCWQKAWCL